LFADRREFACLCPRLLFSFPSDTRNSLIRHQKSSPSPLVCHFTSIAGKGDPVTAVVTKPLFDPQHQLILSEGTELEGAVLQAKPSRSFGRNGRLRFTFRSIKRTGENAEHIPGTLTGAEGNASQNVSVDPEGNVKSNPDKNRFVAPLLLGVSGQSSLNTKVAASTPTCYGWLRV
jgi:hypothetical protein